MRIAVLPIHEDFILLVPTMLTDFTAGLQNTNRHAAALETCIMFILFRQKQQYSPDDCKPFPLPTQKLTPRVIYSFEIVSDSPMITGK